MCTMDAESVFARLAGRHWPWYMRMHFYYFTKDSMARMLRAAGFNILSIERHKRLLAESVKRLERLGYTNITAIAGDGMKGWPEQAPFDRIIVTAAARGEVPAPFIEQLAPGGVLVLTTVSPIGFVPNLLRRFLSDQGKTRGRRVTRLSRKHQRQLSVAVKRAREIALLPYVGER